MAHAFFLGIDAPEDAPCTLALVEKSAGAADDERTFRLHRITQEDGAEADAVAAQVQDLLTERPYTARTAVIVNTRTDLGQAIQAALDDLGLAPVAAMLTGSTGAVADATAQRGVVLAEHDAIHKLSQVYHGGMFKLSGRDTEAASDLAHGLQSYQAALNEAEEDDDLPDAPQDAPQRVEAHAPVVTATALATWLAHERSFDPTEGLKAESPIRPGTPTDLDAPEPETREVAE
jgi:hypothetical protein